MVLPSTRPALYLIIPYRLERQRNPSLFLFRSRDNSRTSDRSFGAKQLSLDLIPAEKNPRTFHWFSSPWKVEQPMLWQPNVTCLYAVTVKGPLQGHSQPVSVIAVLVNGWHSQHTHPVMKRQISACFSSISGTASLVSALPLLTLRQRKVKHPCVLLSAHVTNQEVEQMGPTPEVWLKQKPLP